MTYLNWFFISSEYFWFLLLGDEAGALLDQSGGCLASSVERLGEDGGQARRDRQRPVSRVLQVLAETESLMSLVSRIKKNLQVGVK